MNIQKGTRIVIRAKGYELRGVVRVVANRPNADGTIDGWNYWDLEYDIENPLPGHGSYGRWKQSVDGGTVEVLPPIPIEARNNDTHSKHF